MNKQDGSVYVLKCGSRYKIGISVNPQQRLKQIQCLWPEPITLIHQIRSPSYKPIERQLHHRFADKRRRGEWFELSDEDLSYIRSLDVDGLTPAQARDKKAYWQRVI